MSEWQLDVDARGLLCPLPILKTDQAMAGLPTGGRARVLATDPGIVHDLPAWCQVNGHAMVSLVNKGRLWTAIVEKGA